MKRYTVVILTLLAASLLTAVRPSFAQGGSDVITLNEVTPGIDVIITPPAGTSGTVALELSQASIKVLDPSGNLAFQMADSRVHALELRLAPGAGSYTLTAERLAGAAEGFVRVVSQSDLTTTASTTLVSSAQQPLTTEQAYDLPLNVSTPSQAIAVTIPEGDTGTVMATFPGAPVAAQFTDTTGRAVATLYGGEFDGLSLVLDSGLYTVTLLDTDPQQETVANVQVMPPLSSDLEAALPELTAQSDSMAQTVSTTSTASCALTVGVSSVNLRSGPGTGYSVLDYGFRNEQYPVGGMTPDGSWLVVGLDANQSAWVSREVGIVNGNCAGLAVYDIPFRDAPAPQIVVQQAPPEVIVAANDTAASAAPSSSASYSDDHEYEHEDHDEHDDHESHDEHDD